MTPADRSDEAAQGSSQTDARPAALAAAQELIDEQEKR
jgi:hypothetical protein